MKTLIALTLGFITATASADYSVKCETEELVYMNTFSLQGLVYMDDQGITIGNFSVETKNAGNEGVKNEYTLDGRGFTKVYEAGELALDAVTHSQFVKLSEEVAYISVSAGMPGPYTSQIRMTDGTTYFSKCVIE